MSIKHKFLRSGFSVLLALFCVGLTTGASIPSADAKRADFNGVWSAQWCDSKNPQPECGKFDLYLVQEGGRICGQHFVATPGLSRLDEGDPGSVLGIYDGKKATLVIDNTRNGSRYLAMAQLTRAGLEWHLVGMIMPGENDEPAIIPLQKTLVPNFQEFAVGQWEKLKDAPCRWPDEMLER